MKLLIIVVLALCASLAGSSVAVLAQAPIDVDMAAHRPAEIESLDTPGGTGTTSGSTGTNATNFRINGGQGLGAAILDRLERASHDSDIRDTPE